MGVSDSAPAARLWGKRVGTWAVTVGLLYYVLRTVPLSRAWAAVQAAGPLGVLGVGLVYFAYNFAADVLATWATFGWFCAPLRLADVVRIRGVTYLLAVINYNLGQGGIVYFVGRKHGVGLARATGTVLLTMGVMLVGLLVLAAVGSTLGSAMDPRLVVMQKLTLVGLAGFVVYLALVSALARVLARRDVLRPLAEAGVVGHLKAFLARFPHIVGHVIFQWALLRMFGVEISLGTAATLLPVVFVVAWLPIAVQGLGTQQVAAIALLSPYAVGATAEDKAAKVAAFSLSLSAMMIVFSLLTGFAFLRLTSAKAIATGEPGAA